MNARVYANTTSLSLTSDLAGAEFVAPVILAFQTISLQFRPTKEIEGTGIRDNREIRAVAARIGWPDEDPTQGTFELTISLGATDVAVTGLAYNVTAAALKSAIDTALATPLAALVPCTVTDYEGGLRIVFEDNTQVVEIACTDNALWPMSFVEIDEIEWDEGRAYILDLRQTPVAEVSGALETVPDAPEIKVSPESGTQAGGDIDGYLINEIQKLEIPAEFSGGSFILKRSKKSAPLTSPPTLEQVEAALKQIADDGGTFLVTPAPGGVYIEFQGSMAGTEQDPIEVDVFESPGVEYLLTLSTRTAGMRSLMRGADSAGRVEVPLNLDFEIAHPVTDGVWIPVVIPLPLTFSQPVATGDRNVSPVLRYDQPLSKGDYLRHSTASLLIGNRARKFTIGNGSATSFALAHDLVENPQTVTANATTNKLACVDHGYQDLDPITFAASGTLPAPLVVGTLYFVRDAATDDFKVALTANGTAIDLTDTGSGTHTARLKDGTTEGVQVEVWEAAGDEERLPQSSYTVARTSLDVVTLSGFPATPTSGQYVVYVQTVGRPATYQAHTHPLDEILTLVTELDAIKARLAALEALAPSSVTLTRTATPGGSISRSLGSVWAVPRARKNPLKPSTLLDWRISSQELGEKPRQLLRLLPAVHDASTETLPAAPLPAPAASYQGRVFTTASVREDFPGGLLAGDFAACDGREWYRVARVGSESSYYPIAFETLLFEAAVNASELILGSRLDLDFGFEAMVLMLEAQARTRRSACSWSLIVEAGSHTADSSPGTPGSNLAVGFSSPVTLLEQRIVLTEIPGYHTFGVSVSRAAGGTLTATKTLYGETSATTAPASANLALRARLHRFDTENAPTDARGVAAIRGLDVSLDGTSAATLGKLIITK